MQPTYPSTPYHPTHEYVVVASPDGEYLPGRPDAALTIACLDQQERWAAVDDPESDDPVWSEVDDVEHYRSRGLPMTLVTVIDAEDVR